MNQKTVQTQNWNNFQDLGQPPPIPTCENFEKFMATSTEPTVNLQMFSSEIVSHYGITQLPPQAEGEEMELEDEVI